MAKSFDVSTSIPEFEYTIPVDIDDFIESSYTAITKATLVIDSKRPFVMVETAPYKNEKGYVHYAIHHIPQGYKVESKRPAIPGLVSCAIDEQLRQYSLKCADLKWSKQDIFASQRTIKDQKMVFSPSQGYVYFLRAGLFIKIGKTIGHPGQRISALQTGCPFKITLAAHIEGGLEKESELHAKFISYKSHGEWFHDKGELKEFVDSLAGGNK